MEPIKIDLEAPNVLKPGDQIEEIVAEDMDSYEEDAFECPECGGSVDVNTKGRFECQGEGCDLGDYVDCDSCNENLVELPELYCEDCLPGVVEFRQGLLSKLGSLKDGLEILDEWTFDAVLGEVVRIEGPKKGLYNALRTHRGNLPVLLDHLSQAHSLIKDWIEEKMSGDEFDS